MQTMMLNVFVVKVSEKEGPSSGDDFHFVILAFRGSNAMQAAVDAWVEHDYNGQVEETPDYDVAILSQVPYVETPYTRTDDGELVDVPIILNRTSYWE
jgi:hypothetical protein